MTTTETKNHVKITYDRKCRAFYTLLDIDYEPLLKINSLTRAEIQSEFRGKVSEEWTEKKLGLQLNYDTL